MRHGYPFIIADVRCFPQRNWGNMETRVAEWLLAAPFAPSSVQIDIPQMRSPRVQRNKKCWNISLAQYNSSVFTCWRYTPSRARSHAQFVSFTRAHTFQRSSTEIFPVLLNSIGFSLLHVLRVSSARSLLIGSLTLSDQLWGSVGVVVTGRVEGKDFRLIRRCLRTRLPPRNGAARLCVVWRASVGPEKLHSVTAFNWAFTHLLAMPFQSSVSTANLAVYPRVFYIKQNFNFILFGLPPHAVA